MAMYLGVFVVSCFGYCALRHTNKQVSTCPATKDSKGVLQHDTKKGKTYTPPACREEPSSPAAARTMPTATGDTGNNNNNNYDYDYYYYYYYYYYSYYYYYYYYCYYYCYYYNYYNSNN